MNEVATAQNKEVSTQNNIDDQTTILPEEIRLPIIGIIQEKNHLIDQDKDKYEVGQIVDFSNGEIVSQPDENGIHTLKFVPIHFKRVWICKNARTSDSKMYDKNYEPNELIFKTNNPADDKIQEELDLAKQREADPRVKKYLQFLCYVEGQDMPTIISFGKSSRIVGEQFLSRLIFALQGPQKVQFWQRKYKLSTVFSSYKEFNFFKFNIEKDSTPTDEEIETAQSWAETIAKQDYQPEVEIDDEEDTTPKATPSMSDTDEAPY